MYYRDAKGAILVYDITDSNSFLRVQNWVRELKKMLEKDVVIIIVGNKIDLERTRAVNEKDAIEYAESIGVKHLSTSAKLNQGVAELFTELTRQIVLHNQPHSFNNIPRTPRTPNPNPNPNPTFVIKETREPQRSHDQDSGPCCN